MLSHAVLVLNTQDIISAIIKILQEIFKFNRVYKSLICAQYRGYKPRVAKIFFILVWTPELHKNIFACLFSVHNIISLHVMNKYV